MKVWLKPLPFVLSLFAGLGIVSARQQPAAPAPTSKGVIMGTVVDAVTNAAIPNAAVTVSAELVAGMFVFVKTNSSQIVADAQGRFVLSDLQAGRITILASQSGYTEGRTLTDVVAGETLSGIVVRLTKSAVVAGVALDALGEPVVGASIVAARLQIGPMINGQTALVTSGVRGETDARGQYRLSDLTAGTYAIALVSPTNFLTGQRYSDLGFPTTFFPNATSTSDATLLTLKGGEDLSGIDIHVARRPMFTVSGVVTGRSSTSGLLEVRLQPANPGRVSNDLDTRMVSADRFGGAFVFSGVTPGDYTISVADPAVALGFNGTASASFSQKAGGFATTRFAAMPGNPPLTPLPSTKKTLWGTAKVNVSDSNVSNVRVELRPGASIRGRVVFEGSSAPPTGTTLLRRPVYAVAMDADSMPPLPMAGIQADGTFRTTELPPGRYGLSHMVDEFLDGWSLISIEVAGTESPDGIVVLDSSDANVVMKFGDRPTRLAGTVRDAEGKPSPDAVIYVFPTDRRRWGAPSGIENVPIRPSRNGTYQTPLRKGDYFVVAVASAKAEDWQRPDNLDVLARRAKTVTVGTGQTATLDLIVPKDN